MVCLMENGRWVNTLSIINARQFGVDNRLQINEIKRPNTEKYFSENLQKKKLDLRKSEGCNPEERVSTERSASAVLMKNNKS